MISLTVFSNFTIGSQPVWDLILVLSPLEQETWKGAAGSVRIGRLNILEAAISASASSPMVLSLLTHMYDSPEAPLQIIDR